MEERNPSIHMDIPSPLRIENKLISFPYITKNKLSDPVHRLMVNIHEIDSDSDNSSHCNSAPLKYVFAAYYPHYNIYLQKHKHTTLQQEIQCYYNVTILKAVEYKYEVNQFGYIKLKGGKTQKRLFVKITKQSDCKRKIFFLHEKLRKYQYTRYDITSTTAKILTDNKGHPLTGWINENAFKSIDGTVNNCTYSSQTQKRLIELCNWKICREDYLLKRLNHKLSKISETKSNDMATVYSSNESQQISYSGGSEWSSYGSDISECISTDDKDNNDEQTVLFEDFGYYKGKHLCYTLKGEIFAAANKNNKNGINIDEEVAIKKFISYENANRNIINTKLVKQALINRNLKTKNTKIQGNVVKYIDFFKIKSNYFGVFEKDFNTNLAEFVTDSLKYISTGKLLLSDYNETMQYLLWRLSIIIHWTHSNIQCCDLDICAENIMLSNAEFVPQLDGSVAINLKIDVKFIDFGLKEIFYSRPFDKCKLKYNKKYFDQLKNKQFITANYFNNLKYYNPSAADMFNFGMVMYYCFVGNYPHTDCSDKILSTKTETCNDINYWSVYNHELNKCIRNNLASKLVDAKISSLICGLLTIDETKRLKSTDVLQHKWFNALNKTVIILES